MERNVKLRIKIDFKAMKYYNLYNFKYKRKIILFYILLAIFCAFAAVYTFLQEESNAFFSLVFAVFAVFFTYQTINIEKLIDRQVANYFFKSRTIPQQNLEISDEQITISSPLDPTKSVTYDWLQVTAIHEIPEYYYLFIHKQPIIIDKDPGVILEGLSEDLKAIIAEKAKGKPYKLITKDFARIPVTFVHEEEFDENTEDLEIESEETVVDEQFDEAEEIKVEVEDENIEEVGIESEDDNNRV